MRFAAFIKEKRRELRRLGRLIFPKCLNRFLGGKRRMKRLRATQRWILASLRSWAAVLLFFFFFFSLSPRLFVFPHSKAASPLHYPEPAGCLISCAAPRPFQSSGLPLCLIQAAVSASSNLTANIGVIFFFLFTLSLTK